VPAPMSRTSSPGATPESATIRSAHTSVSGCHPQARRDCRAPDTTHLHKAHRHAPDVRPPANPVHRVSSVRHEVCHLMHVTVGAAVV
jgi:hypothetical protein